MAFADIKSQLESQGSGLLGRDWRFPSDWPTDKTLDEYLNMVKGSAEYQAKQGGGNSEEGADLSIPADAYPWSRTGLPQWGLDTIKQTTAALPGLLTNYQGAIGNLEQAPALIKDLIQTGGDTFLKGLNPFMDYLRSPLDKANARGLGDSTLTRDIAVNLGGLLGDDFRKQQTDLTSKGLELGVNNLAEIAKQYGTAYASTAGLLSSAQVAESQNKLAQYETLLNALLG